jgi:phosphonopyruvate decarboxylase
MIYAENLLKFLNKKDINFFSGVPDSILKNFCDIIENNKNHYSSTNEGSAVSLGIGYYLSTKKIPCIYLQNSGLSNALNPLISIMHKKVYSIPSIFIIGWRGSPGIKDEPQHVVKGGITENILKSLNFKYIVLNDQRDFAKLSKLIDYSKKKLTPVFCLVKKNKIISKTKKNKDKNNNKILRFNFLEKLLIEVKKNTKIISTTGYTSRELMKLRENPLTSKGSDFYMVGGMGHSAMVALGISINNKKEVVCLDGDGSILMHLGSLSKIGLFAKKNFKHILLNNYSHESVGGQKTLSKKVNFKTLTKSMGYKKYFFLKNNQNIQNKIKKFLNSDGPSFLEVCIKNESIKNLPRPVDLHLIKKKFMKR